MITRPRRPRWIVVIRRMLALLLLLGVVELGAGLVEAQVATHPPIVRDVWPAGGYLDLKLQRISFMSRTGVRIVGRFFAGRSRATIILTHGYGQNENQMLPWAAFLHHAGFSVLTYDLRGHGGSGGAVTFGALEQYDLISAVDYLLTRRDVDGRRIGALGVSLGGAITILAAARDRRIKAIVDDCGYSDLRAIVDSSAQHFVGLPAFVVSPFTIPIAEWRAGVSIDAVRPMSSIGRISPRPVFIIHGFADKIISPANSLRNYDAAGRPKQLWFVPGAGHSDSRLVAGAEYARRVVAFFRRYLR